MEAGDELITGWREVTQEQIDAFAAATDDRQWIHVDPDAAADGPFGTTVAHGFLTLSLLVPFLAEAVPVAPLTVNYGLDRVRFTSPLPAGSRVRCRFRVESVAAVDDGEQVTLAATVEREGQEKPVLVAAWIVRRYGHPVAPQCSHLDEIRVTELPASIAGCEECLKTGDPWVHLRMCLGCGKIGCCDSSPNRHASRHAAEAGHPIARSAEPGETWAWCYVDQVGLDAP